MIDDLDKERVKAASDIVDVLSGYMDLRRSGRGFAAVCPFHSDRRPSLQVNPGRQIWRCFVCDIGGDVFSFVMRRDGLTFPAALQLLADRAGIALTNTRGPTVNRAPLFDLMKWAVDQYRAELKGKPFEYVTSRGISAESIERFGVGYAPANFGFIATKRNDKELEDVGLVVTTERGSRYDRFRNRVMFPIRDSNGRVIAFGGRVLPGDDQPGKYINSPETSLFRKSDTLYALDLAKDEIRKTRTAIVTEGYTDVIACHQHGLTNTVAVLGTALGTAHIKSLRHLCDRVVLLLDGDKAGQKRSDEVLDLFLNSSVDVRIATIPGGLDPAECIETKGVSELRMIIDKSVDAIQFKINRSVVGFDPLKDAHQASEAINNIVGLLAKSTGDTIKVDQVLRRMSLMFGITFEGLMTTLKRMQSKAASRAQPKKDEPQVAAQPPKLEISNQEKALINLMLHDTAALSIAMDRIDSKWLSEPAKELFNAIISTEIEGEVPNFDTMMLRIDDLGLQSVLVSAYNPDPQPDAARLMSNFAILLTNKHERLEAVEYRKSATADASTMEDRKWMLAEAIRDKREKLGTKLKRPRLK